MAANRHRRENGVGLHADSARCPFCGHTLSRQHGSKTAPADGDFSICWNCETVAVIQVTPVGVLMRSLTDEEAQRALADPDLMTCMRVAKQAADPEDASLVVYMMAASQAKKDAAKKDAARQAADRRRRRTVTRRR